MQPASGTCPPEERRASEKEKRNPRRGTKDYEGTRRKTKEKRGAFCKIRQSAGFIAGKDCDSRERGRPARTRPGREVAIGLTDLVGSPYDRHRAAALQECGRDARAPGGEPTASQVQIHPEPADHDRCPPLSCPIANFAKGSEVFRHYAAAGISTVALRGG